jgi:hypothetical protein
VKLSNSCLNNSCRRGIQFSLALKPLARLAPGHQLHASSRNKLGIYAEVHFNFLTRHSSSRVALDSTTEKAPPPPWGAAVKLPQASMPDEMCLLDSWERLSHPSNSWTGEQDNLCATQMSADSCSTTSMCAQTLRCCSTPARNAFTVLGCLFIYVTLR